MLCSPGFMNSTAIGAIAAGFSVALPAWGLAPGGSGRVTFCGRREGGVEIQGHENDEKRSKVLHGEHLLVVETGVIESR